MTPGYTPATFPFDSDSTSSPLLPADGATASRRPDSAKGKSSWCSCLSCATEKGKKRCCCGLPCATVTAVVFTWLAFGGYISVFVTLLFYSDNADDKTATAKVAGTAAALTAFVVAVGRTADGCATERKREDDRQMKVLEQLRSLVRTFLGSEALSNWRKSYSDACQAPGSPTNSVDRHKFMKPESRSVAAARDFVQRFQAGNKVTKALVEICWLVTELKGDFFEDAQAIMTRRIWPAMLLYDPKWREAFATQLAMGAFVASNVAETNFPMDGNEAVTDAAVTTAAVTDATYFIWLSLPILIDNTAFDGIRPSSPLGLGDWNIKYLKVRVKPNLEWNKQFEADLTELLHAMPAISKSVQDVRAYISKLNNDQTIPFRHYPTAAEVVIPVLVPTGHQNNAAAAAQGP